MENKENILDLYYNKHLKQKDIATIVGVSKQYVSKIIKADSRCKEEKQISKDNNAIKRKNYMKEYFKSYDRPKKNQFIGDHYTLEEFDFTNNTITIKHKVIEAIVDDKRTLLLKDKTKNKSSYRSLPLIPEIKEALLEHKKKIENNKKLCGNSYMKEYKDYIFVDNVGKIFRPEYITDHFSLLLKKQNLRHIRFHDLRHSCASLLLAKNVPMKAIQEWLGHSTYSTTANLYTHLESNTKNISANVLSEAISF